MAEETNQYLNGERYMNDKYGQTNSHINSIWRNIEQGARSAYSFYAPWDTALSSDAEFVSNSRGGFLMGFLHTGAQRALQGGIQTYNQTVSDEFLSNLVVSDRLADRDEVRKGKYYADKAIKGKEANLMKSFDKLANIDGMDKEVVEEERKRAIRVMNISQSKSFKELAKQAGIAEDSEDYTTMVSLYAHYDQLRQDALQGYLDARKGVQDVLASDDFSRLIYSPLDESLDADARQKALDFQTDQIKAEAKLQAYKQALERWEAIKDDAEELAKLGLPTNKKDIEENINILKEQIANYTVAGMVQRAKAFDKAVDKEEVDKAVEAGEDTGEADAFEDFDLKPLVDAYDKLIPFEIDLLRAGKRIDSFTDKEKSLEERGKEVKALVDKYNKVQKEDEEFQQRINDEHTGANETITPEEEPAVE
jgi:hypothetical protein